MVRTTFTTITPLPASITRSAVVEFLHDHVEMIDLNPLIVERHTMAAPAHAPAEERGCVWYSLTDKIAYLPGGLVSGQVSYTCAFHDLPDGLQTHCYAPLGLELRDRWSVAGSLPGEPVQPVELGLGAPATGLYLREDVDMTCNFLMASFVKKTLKKSHGSLVRRMAEKTQLASTNGSQRQSIHAPPLPRPQSIPSWPTLADGGRESTVVASPAAGVPSTGLPSQQQHYAGQTLGPYGARSQSSVLGPGLHPTDGGQAGSPGSQDLDRIGTISGHNSSSLPTDHVESPEHIPDDHQGTRLPPQEPGVAELDSARDITDGGDRRGLPRAAELE